jgi:hypothetical protein
LAEAALRDKMNLLQESYKALEKNSGALQANMNKIAICYRS